MKRPYTTLFMLTSVDGKISTGDNDSLDVDKDYKSIDGLKDGLQQYYNLEQETDLFSLNTGRVFEKIGINQKTDTPEKAPVSFIVIDNKPHLNVQGLSYLLKKSKTLFIVTTNSKHPVFQLKENNPNLEILFYESEIDFNNLFEALNQKYGVENMTIQSGGTLNSTFIREGLVDRVLLIVAPVLIGGKDTSTLVDGESLHTEWDLLKIKTLKLVQAKPLENSYLLLEYKVNN